MTPPSISILPTRRHSIAGCCRPSRMTTAVNKPSPGAGRWPPNTTGKSAESKRWTCIASANRTHADQASFNSGLLQAVQDDDRRKQAVARGRQVAAEYNWQKCGEQTLDLYRQCQ